MHVDVEGCKGSPTSLQAVVAELPSCLLWMTNKLSNPVLPSTNCQFQTDTVAWHGGPSL